MLEAPGELLLTPQRNGINIARSHPAQGSHWGAASPGCHLQNVLWTADKFLKDSAESRSPCARFACFQLLDQKQYWREGTQPICWSEPAAPIGVVAAQTQQLWKTGLRGSLLGQLLLSASHVWSFGQAFSTRNSKGEMKQHKSSFRHGLCSHFYINPFRPYSPFSSWLSLS